MPRPSKSYAAEQTRQLLLGLFGSSTFSFLVAASILLVLLGLFATAIHELGTAKLDEFKPYNWAFLCSELTLFPVAILIVYLFARKAQAQLQPMVRESKPDQVEALVLFLSPVSLGPGRDDSSLVNRVIAGEVSANLLNPRFRDELKGPWRMALESIAYHVGHLHEVIVIGSADSYYQLGIQSSDADSSGRGPDNGTIHTIDLFRDFVAAILPDDEPKVAIHALHEILESVDVRLRKNTEFAIGVNFESIDEVAQSAIAAYESLRLRGFESHEIIIDVTGGQKTTSIGGALLSSARGIPIQYVSTKPDENEGHRVRTYHISYSQA